jgi:uncharacterized protein YdaU (DUF1376 family)
MTTSEKPDWFKMSPAQFLQDGIIDAMSTLELGATFRLLCRQWIDGDLVDDKGMLARQARLTEEEMERAWPVLSQFFRSLDNGRRANRFMWVERQAVAAKCESKSDTFRALARKRWDNARKPADRSNDGDVEGNAARNAQRYAARIRDAVQEQSREEQSREDALLAPCSTPIPIAAVGAPDERLPPFPGESEPPQARSDAFVAAWNENRGELSRVLGLSDDRRKKLQARIRGGLAIERFAEAVKVCAITPFLTGSNDRKWRASFDWLIGNDSNLLKVLEGTYAGSSTPRPVVVPRSALHADPLPPHRDRVVSLDSIRAQAGLR